MAERPETIVCDSCGTDAPNSKRGRYRRYCIPCVRKNNAIRIKAKRDSDPEYRRLNNEMQARRRRMIRNDPEAFEREREVTRLRQARYRAKRDALNEVQAELIKSRVELNEATGTLNATALKVNEVIADHEQRIQALERSNHDRDDRAEQVSADDQRESFRRAVRTSR